jgi:hypothetical protein
MRDYFTFLKERKRERENLPHHAAAEQSHTENKNEVTGRISVLFLRIIALHNSRGPEDKDGPVYYRDPKKKKKSPHLSERKVTKKNADGTSQETHPKNHKPGIQELLHIIQQRIHTDEKCLHPNTAKPPLNNKKISLVHKKSAVGQDEINWRGVPLLARAAERKRQ